jgi:hypothetical protein
MNRSGRVRPEFVEEQHCRPALLLVVQASSEDRGVAAIAILREPEARALRSLAKRILRAVVSKLLFVALASVVILGCGGNDVSEEERDRAITAAKQAYRGAIARGENLDVGPCIAENLPRLPEWVADVAHDPREGIDDASENQCRRYRAGEASHFVELTPDGELIRAE